MLLSNVATLYRIFTMSTKQNLVFTTKQRSHCFISSRVFMHHLWCMAFNFICIGTNIQTQLWYEIESVMYTGNDHFHWHSGANAHEPHVWSIIYARLLHAYNRCVFMADELTLIYSTSKIKNTFILICMRIYLNDDEHHHCHHRCQRKNISPPLTNATTSM